jgi:hypothetical protein
VADTARGRKHGTQPAPPQAPRRDPLLQARLAGEHRQTARIASGLARRIFVVPWLPEPPVGVQALASLTAPSNAP